ncbi:MAG: hypothetical protein ACLQDQ_02985 [Myxococcaceae bacterium]
MRKLRLSVLAATLAFATFGCATQEAVAVRPPPCPGAAWVEGHYGPYGHWHAGHWVCPAVVVVPPSPARAPAVVVNGQ